MHTEHLYNTSMNYNTFDFAQLGLTVARFASQLKQGISIDCSMSFGTDLGTYCIIGLFKNAEEEGAFPTVIKSFYGREYENVRELLDIVFAFCIENDLFKQPLDIKLVD